MNEYNGSNNIRVYKKNTRSRFLRKFLYTPTANTMHKNMHLLMRLYSVIRRPSIVIIVISLSIYFFQFPDNPKAHKL